MISHVTTQHRAILLIALLGIRRIQREERPKRKRVLNFIRLKKLMAWEEKDLDWCDAGCLVWENTISWTRKDLVDDGLIVWKPGMEKHGIWELSEFGVKEAEGIVMNIKKNFDKDPRMLEKFKGQNITLKLTDGYLNLALQLAHDDFSKTYYPTQAQPDGVGNVANAS